PDCFSNSGTRTSMSPESCVLVVVARMTGARCASPDIGASAPTMSTIRSKLTRRFMSRIPSSAERPVEGPLHGSVESVPEFAIAREESLAGARQAHAASGAAAGNALHELEPRGGFELLQVPPGVPIGHLELFGRLPQRAALLDRLQQSGPTVPELEVVTERHPHLELGLHDDDRYICSAE